MPDEILPDVYRIEVPLPGNPLKAINSYVFMAGERNLVVDTGMNREECATVLRAGLAELGVDLAATDFFATHLHADHYGLIPVLATETSTVYFNQPDAAIIRSGGRWAVQLEYARRSGFPENQLQDALQRHPGYRYTAAGHLDYRLVRDGDRVAVGDYESLCLETPGHTPGHTCLYEPAKKILVAGDHLLEDITPNISSWLDWGNPLGQYLDSLDKIYRLDVELVLPGHRRVFRDHRRRIDELRQHHRARADEILAILKRGEQNAFEIASQMTWDLTYKQWEQFPVSQKWFATGEAIAHLKYLEHERAVRKEERGGRIVYSLP